MHFFNKDLFPLLNKHAIKDLEQDYFDFNTVIKESEIINACASHFRKQKYLEKNISIDKLMNDISSGKLAQTAVNKIVEPLQKASEAKVKKNIENERKQQKNAGRMTM